MPAIFVTLAIPPGLGVGAPSDVHTFQPGKSIVVGGTLDPATGETLLVEGSLDPAASAGSFFGVAGFLAANEPPKAVDLVLYWMRVRRLQPSPLNSPNVEVGSDTDSTQTFFQLTVPSSGAGASVDVSAGGAFVTVNLQGGIVTTGQVPQANGETFLVEGSNDNVAWTGVAGFQSDNAGPKTFERRYNFLRVRRPVNLGSSPTCFVGTSTGEAGGGVTQLIAGTNISLSPASGLGIVTINSLGGAATWPIGNPRVYAVDGVNGIDTNRGFADAASGSAADYRAACAAAGLVAKKTIAGLAAIFPSIGADRLVFILIAAGTYTDDLATAIGGVEGYRSGCPVIRGTVTDATAGAVAFSGSDADEVMAGGVTATGMNAAGYNPLVAGLQSLQLGKAGGAGDPGFAAEPAIPLGFRVRFDSATTTAALRGLTRQVSLVSGTDTIFMQTVLPIAPANTDVCYLEMPGVVIPAINFAGPANGQLGVQFVGLRSSGAWGVQFGDAHFCFCSAATFAAQQQTDNQIVTDQSFTNPILGVRSPGGGFRAETTAEINRGGATLAGLVSGTSTTLRTMQDLAWGVGCAARNLAVLQCWLDSTTDTTTTANIGTSATAAGIPHTFGSDAIAGLFVDGSAVEFANLNIIGAGAQPGLAVGGTCHLSTQNTTGIGGTTGNLDVGLDLQRSTGSQIALNFAGVPTVTGALGDIRWSGPVFDIWASFAVQEQYDAAGNHIFLAGTNIGQASITPSVDLRVNNSGAGTDPAGYLFVRKTGAADQFRPAVPGDTPDGILGTAVGNGTRGIVGAIGGYRVVSFDGAPVEGAFVYISTGNTGKGTTTNPGDGQQPLGVLISNAYAANRGLVHFGAATSVPTLVAAWSLGLLRVFAIDPVNGLDTNRGYADPASSSAADYAIACAAAGARAKRTIAGLTAIFPKFGAGRLAEIVIANAGVNTASAFAETLGQLINGVWGYALAGPVVRGTGTNTTAGAVAFDGSTADVIYQGAITVTGLNVAGYNPVGATTTSLPCQLAGGGAAGLPAEPAAPLGWRVRFDAATATVALRNQCRQIAQVSGGDTIVPQTAFGAAPANADVFYIEQPGVTVTIADIITGSEVGGPSNTALGIFGFQITCVRWTSTLNMSNVECRFGLAGAQTLNITGPASTINCGQIVGHPVLGSITVGGGFRGESGSNQMNVQNNGRLGGTGLVIASATTFLAGFLSNVLFGSGSFCAGALQVSNCSLAVGTATTQVTPQIGTPPGAVRPPRSARLVLSNVRTTLGEIVLAGSGANPAISLQGCCQIAFAASTSGTTGNNDVGLDLTTSRGSLIILAATPTVTGALGDVRLAGGQIITWAQAIATGIVDSAGNQIVGTAGTPPLGSLKFTGSLFGGAGLVNSYCADDAIALLVANSLVAIRYPTSQRLFTRLRVNVLALSTNTINNTVTLYKNGVATAMTVTIPAATAAFTKLVDAAHPILFADGDDLALRMDNAGADVAAVTVIAASVEHTL